MLKSSHLKIVALMGISLFCTNASSGELCNCPVNPKGTECNNYCNENPGGSVWQEDPPPPVGTVPPPPANKEPNDKKTRKGPVEINPDQLK